MVLNLLKEKLNACTKTIPIKDCVISSVSLEKSKDFLEKYHIKGCSNFDFAYGVYYKNELLMIMTFKTKEEGGFELTRYCKKGVYVSGGFQKLLEYSIMNLKEDIFVFLDRRYWDIKNNFTENGFYIESFCELEYFYSNNREIKNGKEFEEKLKESNLYNNNLTLKENMEKAGYFRIYDCGYFKCVYKY